jgi:hypothetical protein
MGLRLFFLPNFLGATFIQGAMFIPDSRVYKKQKICTWQFGKIGVLVNFIIQTSSTTNIKVLQCFFSGER